MGKWLADRQKKERNFLATATLLPDQFHLYNIPEDGYNRTKKFIDNQVHLKHNRPKGELSDKAQKRIKNAINWLLIRSKPQRVWNRQQDKAYFFRINFITLTLPAEQIHSDKEITGRCLNNFLNILRKEAGVIDYIWKAEAQGNGRIHFHITTNTFIHYSNIRKWWLSSINLLGYVDRFQAKFHHRNPPCSEIKKVKHIRKLAAYLSKYMAKNTDKTPIGEIRMVNGKRIEIRYTDKAYRDEDPYKKVGQVIDVLWSEKHRLLDSNIWGCSQSISKCVPLRLDCTSIQWQQLEKLRRSGKFNKVQGDHVDWEICPGLFEDIKAHAEGRNVSQAFTDDKILQYI
jgi:hypothetical protein